MSRSGTISIRGHWCVALAAQLLTPQLLAAQCDMMTQTGLQLNPMPCSASPLCHANTSRRLQQVCCNSGIGKTGCKAAGQLASRNCLRTHLGLPQYTYVNQCLYVTG
jgi:hypothetical protein